MKIIVIFNTITYIVAVQMFFMCGAIAQGAEKAQEIYYNFDGALSTDNCYYDKKYVNISTAFPISGKASLGIDTRSSTSKWNACFKTSSGLLKEGYYVIEFTARIITLGKDSCLTFLVRPFHANENDPHTKLITYRGIGEKRLFRMSVYIPAGLKNYSFQIHAKNKVYAIVDDIKIYPGGFLAVSDSKMPASHLNCPTGCSEVQVKFPRPKRNKTTSVSDFGAGPLVQDNTKSFNDAIAYCKSAGISRLEVPKGGLPL